MILNVNVYHRERALSVYELLILGLKNFALKVSVKKLYILPYAILYN
jgi:hypothetical protein